MRQSVYERLSRNKEFLMGFAVLWMVMFHTDFTFSGKAIYLPFQYLIKFVGYGSVDLFMFLSGFGLFCSLSKNSEPVRFYKKRLRRLLPSYLIMIIVWTAVTAFLRGMTLPEIAGNLFCTGFWLGLDHQFNWYAQAIWLFYLLTPLFFAVLTSGKHTWLRGLLLLGWGFLMGLAFYGKGMLLTAVSRFPVYLLGMVFGQAFVEKRTMGPAAQAGLILLSAVGILLPGLFSRTIGQDAMWTTGLWRYPLFLAAPGLCILLAYIGDWLRSIFTRPLVTGMEKIGACTFEIYLVQIALYDFTNHLYEKTTVTLLVTMVVTVAVGILFKKTVDYGGSLIRRS